MSIADYPVVGQASSVYSLTSPFGTEAVLNDPDDAAYVGSLVGADAVTGLDGAETSPGFTPFVEADGSIGTPTYLPQRPVTMKGVLRASTIAGRNTYESRLRQVLNEMRAAPGTIEWDPDGGPPGGVVVNPMLNERIQINGGWVKEFAISLRCDDPLIHSQTLHTLTDTDATPSLSVVNAGSAPSIPELVRVTGPVTSARVRVVNGDYDIDTSFRLLGFALSGTHHLDMFPQTGVVEYEDGTNLYGYNDYPTYYVMPVLYPGSNTVTLLGSSMTSATALRVDWRDAWL